MSSGGGGGGGEQAQQEERVLHWLKKRGYTEVAKHYEEDAAGGEGPAETDERLLCKRIGEANRNALLFRSVQLADPQLYHRAYNELQTWTCNALEAYKPELLTVAFPVFVHCYLKLVERGLVEAARMFLQLWQPDHAETYPLELRALAAVQRPDQLAAGNGFVKRALAEKFVLRLSSTSYRLLQGFLSDHNLLPIMEILNERVKVYIEERPPRERFEVVTFTSDGAGPAGGGGRAGGGSPRRAGRGHIGYGASIRWRVTTPKEGLTAEVRATTPLNNDFNAHLVGKLAHLASRQDPHTSGPADASQPTVLMGSITNTYDGCTVARMTDDAIQLAAGFQDRAVRVFRLADDDGPSTVVLRGHSQTVYGLSWAPEQQHLLSSSGDGTVRLWDVAVQRNLCVYRAPTDVPVWDVAFAPVGHYFVSGSYDRVARVWSTNRTLPVRLLVGHYSDVSCVAWHPNCNYVVTGSWDKTARLWDMASGRCFRIYSGHFGPVTALTVSPDGQFLAGAGAAGGSAAEGGGGSGGKEKGEGSSVIRIWEVASGREVALLSGHKGTVHRLCYSSDGKVLASAGADETVRTWDVNGDFAALSTSLPLSPHATFRTKNTPVLDVAFTRRNLLLACGPTSS